MQGTCARALELGVPVVSFTEHVDHTEWLIPADALAESDHLQKFATADGAAIAPPRFDVEGYLAAVDECRDRFPGLRILTGLEMGEPHWHAESLSAILARGSFERLLGSLHCLPHEDRFSEPGYLFTQRQPADVVREYLAEVPRLVAASDFFEVLAHIEYPVRYWPHGFGAFDWSAFEEEFRHALRALADGDRVLELNTGSGLVPELVQWWRDEGGRAISFGSDTHDPTRLAHRFAEATAMVEAIGFRAGKHPWDFWIR
jgi:histidinol-phosphatase (PHP family)